jgi:hypothetical protein
VSDDGLLGRAELERAFSALGDRLVRRGVVADLFIVGGAAMALAYDADRVTRDMDATFLPHGIVLEEARNDSVCGYQSRLPVSFRAGAWPDLHDQCR